MRIVQQDKAQRHISKLSDEQVEREYGKCLTVEKELKEKYKGKIKAHARRQRFYSLGNLQWIANYICNKIGCAKTKVIHLPPEDYRECSHYDGKHIVMAYHTLADYCIFTRIGTPCLQ